jgi:uncharacterized transporter YbjL
MKEKKMNPKPIIAFSIGLLLVIIGFSLNGYYTLILNFVGGLLIGWNITNIIKEFKKQWYYNPND